jgi:hypothetical protein
LGKDGEPTDWYVALEPHWPLSRFSVGASGAPNTDPAVWFSIHTQITCFTALAFDGPALQGRSYDGDPDPGWLDVALDAAEPERAVGVSLLQLEATTIAIDTNTRQRLPTQPDNHHWAGGPRRRDRCARSPAA